MGWVLAHRPDLLEGVHEIFNEGGVNEVVTTDVERYGIEVLQKAFVALYVDAPAKEKLETFRAFLKEKDKELPLRIDPTVREFMRFIAPSRFGRVGPAHAGEGKPSSRRSSSTRCPRSTAR